MPPPRSPESIRIAGSWQELRKSEPTPPPETPSIPSRVWSWFSRRPAAIVVASFALAILLGSALLLIPAATTASGSLGVVDALFTATSATCVTGLIVADTPKDFTPFGQAVILTLIQIGGLGIMTLSMAALSMVGRGLSFRGRQQVGDAMDLGGTDIPRTLRRIVAFTLVFEAVGATALWLLFKGMPDITGGHRLWLAVFHSISAFCNAGFSLFSDSLYRFTDDAAVNLVIALLIIAGGIGYLVAFNIGGVAWAKIARRKDRTKQSLTPMSRVVLATTAILLVGGALAIFIVEWSVGTGEASQRLTASAFTSVTARTAGFNTVPLVQFSAASLFIIMVLMFVGASPLSCGGGIKTTTLAVLFASLRSFTRRQEEPVVWKHTLTQATLRRAIATLGLAIAAVFFGTFLLLITERGTPLMTVLFESVSAFATVGLSLDFTPSLSTVGRLVVVVLMFLGRVGPLTVVLMLAQGRQKPAAAVTYPPAKILIG